MEFPRQIYYLKIPNRLVYQHFRNRMQEWKQILMNKYFPGINNISLDLVNGRYQDFEENLNKFLNIFSYFNLNR